MVTRRTFAAGGIGLILLALVVLAWLFIRSPSSTRAEAIPAATSTLGSTTPDPGGGLLPSAARRSSTATIDPQTHLPWVEPAELPEPARQVLALIDQGGPFPYRQDGQTFGNYERRLPAKPSGFYREYTVKLGSSRDRGPVRIVTGGHQQWYFYTEDHYASFARIRR